MNEHKVGWRYYFFLVLFAAVSIMGLTAIRMLLMGEVMVGDEEMSPVFAVVLSVMIGLVLVTYIETTVVLLRQIVKFDRCGLQITQMGIENTLVFVNILAFVVVCPVRLIPWEAVKYFDFDDDPYIRVDTKKVKAGWAAKLILFVLGYHFCLSFVKPKVTTEQIRKFQHRFAVSKE